MLENFDPNGPGLKNENFIGLPFSEENAELILCPVPWDVTTSYRPGTSLGPENIRQASYQLDLHHLRYGDAWRKGIFFLPSDQEILQLNSETRPLAAKHIMSLEKGEGIDENDLKLINTRCAYMNSWVQDRTQSLRNQKKKIGLIGGDHSTPLGYWQTLDKIYTNWGIIQIDAHMDLRDAYEGFSYSHASVFKNALVELSNMSKLVQVGIRDFCEEEYAISESDHRVHTWFSTILENQIFSGKIWDEIVVDILSPLPQYVYVSLDIDGLDPMYCPHTGTPVPGGLSYAQLVFLLDMIQLSGREIIGFDVCETAGSPHEYDGNVAARLVYHLSLMILST